MSSIKKVISIILVLVLLFNLVACGSLSNTVNSIGDKASQIGGDISNFVSDKTIVIKRFFSELSLPDFKKGVEKVSSFFGSTIASLGGQAYVDKVASAINDLEKRIVDRINGSPIASNAGTVAEEWHAGTYNIDAVARGSNPNASTDKSHSLGSVDVSVGDELSASVKYYKTADLSASQQAKNYIQRFKEYEATSKNPMSMEEWLASNNINITENSELYWSIYKDQIRIIPSDQLESAKKSLEKAIAKESANGGTRKLLAETDIETLKNLTDRIKTSDGTQSMPLSKQEAEAIAKAGMEGDFSAAEFGVTTASAIKGSYVAKQALKGGATSAIIEAALVLGPEIYEIIKNYIDTGELDLEQLKTAGSDGLSAARDGYLKGSISTALIVLCQAGKLGAEFMNCSPEVIGTLTVLIIDAIKYGIMMGEGKISTNEYLDLMAEEALIGVGVLGTTALLGLLFPGATLAILLGSFVSGLILSAGYSKGKTYVLAWIKQSGIDLLVPVSEAAESIKGFKETVVLKVSEAIESLKNIGSNTAKNVRIKVYDLSSTIYGYFN